MRDGLPGERCRRGCAAASALLLLLLGGCVPEAKYSEVVGRYRDASADLGQAAGLLFANANTVEAESYIDTQAFERQPLSPAAIRGRAVLSENGLRLREQAIAAISAYTVALAGVVSGRSEQQIAADASAAGAGLASLTVDAEAAAAKADGGAQTTDFSGAVSAAVAGAGELLKLLEQRHSRAEVQTSLRTHDAAIEALIRLLGADAERLYVRQRLALQNRGDIVFESYAVASRQSPADAGYVLALSEQIKQYGRDLRRLDRSDPAAAFADWEHAHAALVTALEDGGSPAQSAQLQKTVAAVDEFAAEAHALVNNLQMLDQSR